MAGKRKLTLLDRLRGWHWRSGVKTRNWCLCPLEEG
jgi:hypothetical protein